MASRTAAAAAAAGSLTWRIVGPFTLHAPLRPHRLSAATSRRCSSKQATQKDRTPKVCAENLNYLQPTESNRHSRSVSWIFDSRSVLSHPSERPFFLCVCVLTSMCVLPWHWCWFGGHLLIEYAKAIKHSWVMPAVDEYSDAPFKRHYV